MNINKEDMLSQVIDSLSSDTKENLENILKNNVNELRFFSKLSKEYGILKDEFSFLHASSLIILSIVEDKEISLEVKHYILVKFQFEDLLGALRDVTKRLKELDKEIIIGMEKVEKSDLESASNAVNFLTKYEELQVKQNDKKIH